jgi:hypothetical protein
MFWYASFAALVWSMSVNPGAMDVAGVQIRQAVIAAPNQVAALVERIAEEPVNTPAEVVVVEPAEVIVEVVVEAPAETCPGCPIIVEATEAPPAAIAVVEEDMIWPDVGEVEREDPAPPAVEMIELVEEQEPMIWWQAECMPRFGEPAAKVEADIEPLQEDAAGDPLVEDVRGLVDEVAQVLQQAVADLKDVHLTKLRQEPLVVWRLLGW